MTPRTRVLIVLSIALLFVCAGATALYCVVSSIQGNRLYARGYAEMSAGHYDAAIALYSAASRKMLDSSTLALVYQNRGRCYAKKGNDEQAIQDFTESIRLDPSPIYNVFDRGLAYVRKGEYEKARADLNVTLEKNPNLTEAYFNRAWISMFRGEWDLAIADFSEAIQRQPREPQYYVDRGMAYAANEQLDPAIASFDSALALNPLHAGAYIQRAAAYARKGNPERGLMDVTDAIAKMPDVAQLYYARAYIYLDRGILDRGVDDGREALRLRPDYDYAYLLLGRAALQDRNWPEVFAYANKTMELNPRLAAAHYLRGRVLTSQGKYEEAIAEFNRTLKMEPAFVWALSSRAQNYAYLEQYSRANDELRAAVARFPKAEVPHLALGWFLATCPHDAYRNGKEAVAEATKGCELSHWKNWYGLDTLSVAYAELGDFEQATTLANRALQLPGPSEKDRLLIEKRLARYAAGISIRDIGGAEVFLTLFEEAIRAYNRHDFDRTIRCLNLVLLPNTGGSVTAALFGFFDGTHDSKQLPPWSPRERDEMTNGFYYRGLAYERRREWDKSLADFSTAIRREPTSSVARAERAICYEHQGDADRAFAEFEEMLRLNPDDARAYALRAELLQVIGQDEPASEAANTAIQLDRKLALAHDVLGRIYARKQDLPKADREFDEAERLEPNHVEDALASASYLEQNHDYAQAEAEFRQIAALFPRSASAQNALAWFLSTGRDRARRNGREAIQYANRACELSKWNNAAFVDTLAAAYAEIGDFDTAIKYQMDALAKPKQTADEHREMERHLVASNAGSRGEEDKQNPRRISPTGARLTIGPAYFAQQGSLIGQQPPSPQQSAEREVALAVPTSARAAMIANKYLMESSCMSFLPTSSRRRGTSRHD
jgi:tetratricopeptide (TPR) repeat protein